MKLISVKYIFFLIYCFFYLNVFSSNSINDSIKSITIVNKIINQIELSNTKIGINVSVLQNKKTIENLNKYKKTIINIIKNDTKNKTKLLQILNEFYIQNIKKNFNLHLIKDVFLLIDSFNKNYILNFEFINSLSIEVKKNLLDANYKNKELIFNKDEINFQFALKNKFEIIDIIIKNKEIKNIDSLIKIILNEYPQQIFEILINPNKNVIDFFKNTNNLYLQTIYKLSNYNKKEFLMPFFVEIIEKKLNVNQILEISKNHILYYKLLIKTRQNHLSQIALNNKIPYNFNMIYETLLKFSDKYFITKFNERHFLSNNLRFKELNDFNLTELYYLIICGDDLLYTSSFIYIYQKLFQKFKDKGALFLLQKIQYDKYKKFIKIIANYNCFHGKSEYKFLNNIDKISASILIKSFITNIDLKNKNYLEEASDIVNSFTGFDSAVVKDLNILSNIENTLDSFKINNNKKGIVIYNIFKDIFNFKFSKNYNLEQLDSIINKSKYLDYKILQANNSSIKKLPIINEQVFFYGDDDAENSFNYFLYKFNNKNWKIDKKQNWVVISSTKGLKINIYANIPIISGGIKRVYSQTLLMEYLKQNNILPKIIVHRGHSYFLFNTINKINPNCKLLFLGSCGSNNLIYDVLKICPTAQIISTKQIATSVVNSTLFFKFNELLRTNNNINWEQFWHKLKINFQNTKYQDIFEEYIPPYENLSSIFFNLFYKRSSQMY